MPVKYFCEMCGEETVPGEMVNVHMNGTSEEPQEAGMHGHAVLCKTHAEFAAHQMGIEMKEGW